MKIALIGDIAFFGKNTVNNNNFKDYFSDIHELLNNCDLVVGNLETPFVGDSKPFGAKSAYIKSSADNVELLKYLNVKAVTLANNHVYDFGIDALNYTREVLDDNDIAYYGIGNKDFLVDSERIAFSGYCCYSTNPIGVGESGIVDELDYNKVINKITKYDSEGYLNILSVHAGIEHINYPDYNDILLARSLAASGRIVYHGHHPHVIQGIEELSESLIAYSLGNFCFDDVYTEKSADPLVRQTDNNKSSIVLLIEVVNGKVISHEKVGVFAGEDKYHVNVNSIVKDLELYSSKLSSPKSEYEEMRQGLLSELSQKRVKKRDFQWYIKRLNFNTIKMLLNGRKNSKLRQDKVIKYLVR